MTSFAHRLLRSLTDGILVVTDRGLSGNALLAAITGTGAHFLAWLTTGREPPICVAPKADSVAGPA